MKMGKAGILKVSEEERDTEPTTELPRPMRGDSIHIPIHQSVYPSIYPSVYRSMYMPVYICVCLCVYLSVYRSVCMPVFLSIYLSVCPSVHPSICLRKRRKASNIPLSYHAQCFVTQSFYLAMCLSIYQSRLSIYIYSFNDVSVCLPACVPACLSVGR